VSPALQTCATACRQASNGIGSTGLVGAGHANRRGAIRNQGAITRSAARHAGLRPSATLEHS
jgi:hypothetical protein